MESSLPQKNKYVIREEIVETTDSEPSFSQKYSNRIRGVLYGFILGSLSPIILVLPDLFKGRNDSPGWWGNYYEFMFIIMLMMSSTLGMILGFGIGYLVDRHKRRQASTASTSAAENA